jgi:predicted aspartyl protease
MVFYDVPASVNSAEMGTSLLGMSFLRRFKKYEFYRDKLILSM